MESSTSKSQIRREGSESSCQSGFVHFLGKTLGFLGLFVFSSSLFPNPSQAQFVYEFPNSNVEVKLRVYPYTPGRPVQENYNPNQTWGEERYDEITSLLDQDRSDDAWRKYQDVIHRYNNRIRESYGLFEVALRTVNVLDYRGPGYYQPNYPDLADHFGGGGGSGGSTEVDFNAPPAEQVTQLSQIPVPDPDSIFAGIRDHADEIIASNSLVQPGRQGFWDHSISTLTEAYGFAADSFQEMSAHFLEMSKGLLKYATTAEGFADIVTSLIPIVNDIKDSYEFRTGRSFIGDHELTTPERILSGVGLVLGSGAMYRQVLSRMSESVPELAGLLRRTVQDQLANGTRLLPLDDASKAIPRLDTEQLGPIESRYASLEEARLGQYREDFGVPERGLDNQTANNYALKRRRAASYLNSNSEFAGKPNKIAGAMQGIDFSQPIQTGAIEAGTRVYQWRVPGENPGRWATFQKGSADGAGISEFGTRTDIIDGVEQTRVVRKEAFLYEVTETHPAMTSFSRGIPDTWSLRGTEGNSVIPTDNLYFPSGADGGVTVLTNGGAQQVTLDPRYVREVR